MNVLLLALQALATLLKNPALGGGGVKTDSAVFLLNHLQTLLRGGQKTAMELKAFAEQIDAMAKAGVQPTQRDFDGWTSRLDAALSVVAEAKARIETRKPKDPPKDPPVDPNKTE